MRSKINLMKRKTSSYKWNKQNYLTYENFIVFDVINSHVSMSSDEMTTEIIKQRPEAGNRRSFIE